jgi:hypothetical protein
MTEQTDINGLTESDRLAAERTEASIQQLRDQSTENLHRQLAQASARRTAGLLRREMAAESEQHSRNFLRSWGF